MTDSEHVNGMLRGALGSLAGLAVMGLYFRASRALSKGGDRGAEGEDIVERQDALDDIAIPGRQAREDEPATAALGRIAYHAATGHDPDEDSKEKLGQAVHWGYGVLVGGLYGALRPGAAAPDLAAGLGYGTALWVLGDEIMVPLLGLAEGPTAHSIPDHAKALGAHLAFGAATATATQALRRVM
jgi:hypothetical protein